MNSLSSGVSLGSGGSTPDRQALPDLDRRIEAGVVTSSEGSGAGMPGHDRKVGMPHDLTPSTPVTDISNTVLRSPPSSASGAVAAGPEKAHLKSPSITKNKGKGKKKMNKKKNKKNSRKIDDSEPAPSGGRKTTTRHDRNEELIAQAQERENLLARDPDAPAQYDDDDDESEEELKPALRPATLTTWKHSIRVPIVDLLPGANHWAAYPDDRFYVDPLTPLRFATFTTWKVLTTVFGLMLVAAQSLMSDHPLALYTLVVALFLVALITAYIVNAWWAVKSVPGMRLRVLRWLDDPGPDYRPVDLSAGRPEYAPGYAEVEVIPGSVVIYNNSTFFARRRSFRLKVDMQKFFHLQSIRLTVSGDPELLALRVKSALRSQTQHKANRYKMAGGSDVVLTRLAIDWAACMSAAATAAYDPLPPLTVEQGPQFKLPMAALSEYFPVFVGMLEETVRFLLGLLPFGIYYQAAMTWYLTFIELKAFLGTYVVLRNNGFGAADFVWTAAILHAPVHFMLLAINVGCDPVRAIMTHAVYNMVSVIARRPDVAGRLRTTGLHIMNYGRFACLLAYFLYSGAWYGEIVIADGDAHFAGGLLGLVREDLHTGIAIRALFPVFVMMCLYVFRSIPPIAPPQLNAAQLFHDVVPAACTPLYLYGYHPNRAPQSTLPVEQFDYRFRANHRRFAPDERPVARQIGPVPLNAVWPVPEQSHPMAALNAIRNRVALAPGPLAGRNFAGLRRFTRRFCRAFIGKLKPGDDVDFDTWLEHSHYNEARKEQLREAADFLPVNQREYASATRVALHIKDEAYEKYKPPRIIAARADKSKTDFGPLIKAVEKIVYAIERNGLPVFPKSIPMHRRAEYLIEMFGEEVPAGFALLETDFERMESHLIARIMRVIEVEVYKWVTSEHPLAQEIMRRFVAVITGVNTLDFRHVLTVMLRAKRMSGEVNTSLGNGLTTMILTAFLDFCISRQVRIPRGCFEGDDGLVMVPDAWIPLLTPARILATTGFRMKLERRNSIYSSLFCGTVMAPGSKHMLYSPSKFLSKIGWSRKPHANFGNVKAKALFRVKVLSFMAMYPSTPVIWKFCEHWEKQTRAYHSVAERLIETDGLFSWWEQQTFRIHGLGGKVLEPTDAEREVVEEVFGMTIEEQLYLESKVVTLPWLGRYELPADGNKDQLDYAMTYMTDHVVKPYVEPVPASQSAETVRVRITDTVYARYMVQPAMAPSSRLFTTLAGLVLAIGVITILSFLALSMNATKQNPTSSPSRGASYAQTGKTNAHNKPSPVANTAGKPIDSRPAKARRAAGPANSSVTGTLVRSRLDKVVAIQNLLTTRGGKAEPRRAGPTVGRRPKIRAKSYRVHSPAHGSLMKSKPLGTVSLHETRSSFESSDAPIAHGTSFQGGMAHEYHHVKDGDHAVLIKGTQFLDTVAYTPGLNVGDRMLGGIYPVNPSALGNRPAFLADMYQEVKCKRLTFHYRTLVPTTTAGALMLSYSSDPGEEVIETGLENFTSQSTTVANVEVPVWMDAVLHVPLEHVMKRYYDDLEQSWRMTVDGMLQILAASSFTGTGVHQVGNLFVEYEFEFYAPKLNNEAAVVPKITIEMGPVKDHVDNLMARRPLVAGRDSAGNTPAAVCSYSMTPNVSNLDYYELSEYLWVGSVASIPTTGMWSSASTNLSLGDSDSGWFSFAPGLGVYARVWDPPYDSDVANSVTLITFYASGSDALAASAPTQTLDVNVGNLPWIIPVENASIVFAEVDFPGTHTAGNMSFVFRGVPLRHFGARS